MRVAIGDAKTCPHGHPIEGIRAEGAPLADVDLDAEVTILRFENEAEELLHYLKEIGFEPGLTGKVSSTTPDSIVVSAGDGEHEITRTVAETVTVRADPAPPPRAALPEQLVISSDRYGR